MDSPIIVDIQPPPIVNELQDNHHHDNNNRESNSNVSLLTLMLEKKEIGQSNVNESFFKVFRFQVLRKKIFSMINPITLKLAKLLYHYGKTPAPNIVKFETKIAASYLLDNGMTGLFIDKFRYAFNTLSFRCPKGSMTTMIFEKIGDCRRFDMLDIIFRKWRTSLMPVAFDAACGSGHFEIIEYVSALGCKPSSKAALCAAKYNRINVLKYLYRNLEYRPLFNDQVSLFAMQNMSHDVMMWLIEQSDIPINISVISSLPYPTTDEKYKFALKIRDTYKAARSTYPEKWDVDLLFMKNRLSDRIINGLHH
ncbi:hypothetical protein PPL_12168 [Heterostelium album PN500]|uniref:Uncharacterized protein n=1 Tax=Heterostelium pallidum (strain ATCC 26659 / Pp 5 / PN500) TaxID=670386 RepID=D3BLW4_HETP5|nr:hypothetical protein PPL_12168 [Heterostelium album PN500]EFA77565.1 hypothetical protein PPL_12168 [Heterostelium album PN500]|eukprot:XP_020429693.1 hypothetical protein PPL_12168 [Heterostelium album PN500]